MPILGLSEKNIISGLIVFPSVLLKDDCCLIFKVKRFFCNAVIIIPKVQKKHI